MIREVLTVCLGVWLALFIRTLFLATLWNTKIWMEAKANRCVKCSREGPELQVRHDGQRYSVCEPCARHDFDMTFDEAVRRGIIRRR